MSSLTNNIKTLPMPKKNAIFYFLAKKKKKQLAGMFKPCSNHIFIIRAATLCEGYQELFATSVLEGE
jgi:hypothetical protein